MIIAGDLQLPADALEKLYFESGYGWISRKKIVKIGDMVSKAGCFRIDLFCRHHYFAPFGPHRINPYCKSVGARIYYPDNINSVCNTRDDSTLECWRQRR